MRPRASPSAQAASMASETKPSKSIVACGISYPCSLHHPKNHLQANVYLTSVCGATKDFCKLPIAALSFIFVCLARSRARALSLALAGQAVVFERLSPTAPPTRGGSSLRDRWSTHPFQWQRFLPAGFVCRIQVRAHMANHWGDVTSQNVRIDGTQRSEEGSRTRASLNCHSHGDVRVHGVEEPGSNI